MSGACNVTSLAVMGAYAAAPVGSTLAAWQAVVPLSALEDNPCDAGYSGGVSGNVGVVAQLITPGSSMATTMDAGLCVYAFVPGSNTCVGTPTPCTAPSGVFPWQCVLPLNAASTTDVAVYTGASNLGRAITWKGTLGIVALTPLASVIEPPPESGTVVSTCTAATQNVGSAVIAGGASPGVDTITATLDGDPTPIGAWTVAVQGAAKIAVGAGSLANNDSVEVTIVNPFALQQTCTVSLPPGAQLQVDGTTDGGADAPAPIVLLDGGDTLDGGLSQDATVSEASVDGVWTLQVNTQEAHVTLSPVVGGVPSATATASITCVDVFGQVGTASIPMGAATTPTTKDSGTTG
ncbi:MAG: hypothetical protein ACHREM_19865 [Polyangiales bacterium]